MPYPYPNGETVTWVQHQEGGWDDYGNPITTTHRVDIPGVAVQPTGSTETQEDYRNPVVTGFTLMLSRSSVKGMTSDDEMEVRGHTCKVQGNPQAGLWTNPFTGHTLGHTLQVKIWEG